MNQRITFLSLFLLLFSCLSFAQKKPFVQASVDKEKIVIGEPFELLLEASFAPGAAPAFFSQDSLPHFEVLERLKVDTLDTGDGLRLSQRLRLTSWDSGSWRLPPLPLPGTRLRTRPVTINVNFTSFDAQQEYHDIKDIREVEAPERMKWIWYLVVALLLGLLFFLVFPGRKKKEAPPAPKVDAYQQALAGLQQLQKERASLEPKAFYVRLVDILRTYLLQRKGIQSFAQTTDDLAAQIRKLQLPRSVFEHLRDTLLISDAVKFARYQPTEEEERPAVQTVQKAIDAIESL
ncbi:hypothetical protein V9K67_19830 [Paraflavisolibacter sp. H34]|uniref:hypothetical protein n=1 Tax=Huijunlia imazamoxiresistens TaxID=3127457 RepID=UPI00301A9B67